MRTKTRFKDIFTLHETFIFVRTFSDTTEVKLFNLVKGEDTENVKEDGIKLTTSEVVLLPQLHLMSAGSRLSRLSQRVQSRQ